LFAANVVAVVLAAQGIAALLELLLPFTIGEVAGCGVLTVPGMKM